MLEAVLIGDLHTDGMTADLGPEANRLQVAEVARAEAWAVRNNISEVWYLGDVCNKSKMSYEAHELLLDLWSTYPHLKRRVILGNHDFDEVGAHSLRLMEKLIEKGGLTNVFIYTRPTREVIGGVKVNFLPYPFPHIDEEDLLDGGIDTYEDCINVSHFEVKGSKRDNGSAGTSKMKVAQDCQWVMGHLHTPHDVGNVHYVGTLFQRNFGESDDKSFTHLKARIHDKEFQCKLMRIKHEAAFKLINLDVATAADLKKVTTNRLHKYKLFISAAVRVPDQFMVDHPNVVRQDNYRTHKERDALVHQRVVLNQTCDQDDPFDFADYLDVKASHLTDKQRARADAIMTEIRGVLEAPTIESLTNG